MVDKLDTNLSVAPYHDDYDESKGYVRVLHVPERGVQVRELNQSQSMSQAQISRFGGHMFKEGAVVDGVVVTYIPNQEFVHVDNITANSRVISAVSNSSFLITANSGVRAVPRTAVAGFKSQYPETNRIYLDYISKGKDDSNNDISTFRSGETLYFYRNQSKLGALDANNLYDSIAMLTANSTVNAVTGSCFAVATTAGTIFQKGFFLKTDPQYVLVSTLNKNTENLTVGFRTEESIVTEDVDPSLLDNANGTSNETAPGAHRLKLTPKLISVDVTTLDANSSFYPIVEFGNTLPVENNAQNEMYSVLGEQMARNKSEESGDFVVAPFSVESIPHANVTMMKYEMSTGIGIVKGHRVEFIGSKTANVARATTTAESQAEIVTANYGNYVICDEVLGTFDADKLGAVSIYDQPQNSISEVEGANAAPSGNVVGTLNVRAVVFDSGTKGTSSARYRIYLTAIRMNSGKSFSSDAKSLYINGTFGPAKADVVLTVNNTATISDSSMDNLVFPVGLDSIKRLTDKNGVNDTQFVLRDTAVGTLQANGTVTFTTNSPYAGGAERLNASVGALSDANETRFDISLSSAAYTANNAGLVTATGNTILLGSGTTFANDYVVGGAIRFGNGDVRGVVAIANNTQMTLNASQTVAANTHSTYFPQGSMMDLTGSGGSIVVSSNTQFTASIGKTLASGSQTVYGTFPILRTQAAGARKQINKDRYVKINCAAAGVGGKYNLGIVDVTEITAVYFGTTYSDSNPDQAAWFNFSTGQTSYEYGHASLNILPHQKSRLTSNTRLLVKLNHFTANTVQGGGFFSVDSYPFIREGETANTTNVPIASVPLVQGYDVRDVIDFRPYRYNTANSAEAIADATENPATANSSYNITSAGSLLVEPDQNFQADVEYYLPRYDLITLSKSGDIIVRGGTPAVYPVKPNNEMDTMAVAEVYVPGFPTLTTREADEYGRQDLATRFNMITNRRWTMQNISALAKRIERLEFYVTLNALEQSARDLTILDENGLDRFKNGIFADSFNSHLIGRVDDFEYKIAIDMRVGEARPIFKTHSVDFMLMPELSSGIQRSGRHISLAYLPQLYIQQPYASKYRNCTESVWSWKGTVELYPGYDHARDEKNLPAVNVTNDLATPWQDFAETPFGTIYGDWETTGVKTDVKTDRSTKDVGGKGKGKGKK